MPMGGGRGGGGAFRDDVNQDFVGSCDEEWFELFAFAAQQSYLQSVGKEFKRGSVL